MAWARGLFTNDPEKTLEYISRDLAMAGIALEQIVENRNLRMMGALRKDANEREIQLVLLAHQGANYCQFMLQSYFLVMYAQYWELREGYAKVEDYRTVNDLHKDLQKFRGTHQLYRSIHEAFMTLFDLKFDQLHTITTMLGIPQKEEDKSGDGLGWLAADEDEVKRRRKARHAARDRARKLGLSIEQKGDYPSFEEAVEFAREHWKELSELDPIVSNFDQFLKELALSEEDPKIEPKKKSQTEPKKEDSKAETEKTETKDNGTTRKVRTAK